jgi:peptidoglycan/LPS O-acetylase OafA/YrhL
MVVAYHAVDQWTTHRAGWPPGDVWPNGAAGVDVFFVVSGLVMTISVTRNAHRPHPGWSFARDRLIRIVPLYWIITTFKIAAVLALPALVARTQLDPLYVAGSYALLPVHDGTGTLRPVLPVGWTLTYEMFFYILVTASLVVKAPLERVSIPVLLIVAAIAIVGPDNGFANTIVLEFLAGVAIGRCLERLQSVPVPWAAVVGIAGFALLLVVPLPGGRSRRCRRGASATADAALAARRRECVLCDLPDTRLRRSRRLPGGRAPDG